MRYTSRFPVRYFDTMQRGAAHNLGGAARSVSKKFRSNSSDTSDHSVQLLKEIRLFAVAVVEVSALDLKGFCGTRMGIAREGIALRRAPANNSHMRLQIAIDVRAENIFVVQPRFLPSILERRGRNFAGRYFGVCVAVADDSAPTAVLFVKFHHTSV